MNLRIVKRPGMKRDSSEFEYDLGFEVGIGQRPLETFHVQGDAALREVLVNHLDQSEGDTAQLIASLNRSPNSATEVISDIHMQGCALQPDEVRLVIRGIETEARQG